jgi:small subunit ribosomal protein S8
MNTDSIGDMLTIIKNGYAASKQVVSLPHSKMKEEIAKKLLELGYLASVEVDTEGTFKVLKVGLRYDSGKPVLTHLRRISKPGLRIYRGKKEVKKVLSGLGFSIWSTPAGILTGIEARKKGVGGEIICEGW